MPRNKYPEITEARILDAATKLFLKNGWKKTTIQDIVDEIGDITRGAFYHHYKSKNDIIDAVTTRLFAKDSSLNNIKKKKDLTGIEKLKEVLLLYTTDKNQLQFAKSAASVLRSSQFVTKQMFDCMHTQAPTIQWFIEEGIADGSITVKYPKQAAETFILLANQWLSPVLFPVSKDEYMKKYEHFKLLFANIGLPVMDNQIRKAFEQYYTIVSI